MKIIAVDPGNEDSAYCLFDTDKEEILGFAKLSNQVFRMFLWNEKTRYERFVIEQIASYGMPVGETVFETCVWTGRFMEVLGPSRCERVKRQTVKLHHCHSPRATDANIRTAMIDRFGEPGTKKNPGKTYGIVKDMWAALAIAVWYSDKINNKTYDGPVICPPKKEKMDKGEMRELKKKIAGSTSPEDIDEREYP